MDTSTLVPPGDAPHSPPPASSGPASPSLTDRDRTDRGLAAEVRESLLLLGFAVGVTVGLTTAAQAALALLA